ncbi:MAG: ABC transporter permease [Parvularculaceae bacterium]
MRETFLIALREYKQYILSRGFLLFLIMFPVGVIFGGAAIGLLENSRPARPFVVFDETGAYADEIDREIERRHMIYALSAWDAYLNAAAESDALEQDRIPEPFAPSTPPVGRLDAFKDAGGFDAAQAAVAPHLKPGAPAFTPPKRSFFRLPLPGDVAAAGSVEEAVERLRPYLLEERRIPDGESETGAKLFAAVLIPKGFGTGAENASAEYWSRNLTDPSLQSAISRALDAALQREAVARFGLSAAALDDIADIDAPVSAFRPDKAPGEAELGLKDKIETAMPAALTYMLLVIVFGVGNLLLTNTIEERSNKIVEVLLSSVTADQLMLGKLIGIGAVGLTMPAIFLTGGLIASFTAMSGNEIAAHALSALFSSNLLAVYLFYFFCAYAIFAMIFLAIGAVSNSLQDAQSYMGPVMILVFAPMPFMVLIFQNPNGLAASILTWIPIYTPYAVMMRAASDPPLWEVAGATALMLAFAIFLMRIMGRIFRQAILQASPPKARDLWRLARGKAA